MAIGQTRRPWRLAGCPRGSPSVARGAVLGAAVCAVVVTMAAVASGGEPGFSEEGSAQQLQTMDLRKLQQIAAGLIAGGRDAPCKRYAYMVSLRDDVNDHRCGGVLVKPPASQRKGPSWVLTAAHCLDGLGSTPVVVIGACNLNDVEGVEKLLPTAAIVHEKWTGAVEDGYDIALLRLEKKSKFAKFAIGLPGRCEATGTALFVTLGWGGTENDTTSDALQVAERFKFLTGEDCAAEDLWGSTYQDSMLCAVGGKPGVETCPGDSGGPMVRAFAPGGDVDLGRPDLDVLFGITSFGERGTCGATELPGVYTAVSHYIDWIDFQIAKNCVGNNCPAVPTGDALRTCPSGGPRGTSSPAPLPEISPSTDTDRPPVTSPPPTSTSDGMLKFPDAEICKFRDDECSAAVVENIQDVKLLEPLAATRCAETTSQERCDSNDFCSWDRIASSCVGDVELALKDCLIPEWLTVKRFASCDTKASEEKCTILPGCLWNNEACESDLTSGVATEALQNSPEVAAALNEQTTCNTTGLDACLDDSKCLLIGGECRSSAFWKISGWFDPEADSALCLFYGAVYKCSDAVLPDCPSGCIVDEDVCDITLEAIAETAFDAEFAAVMKTALQECPLQESESDCSSFRL
ncbi:unnamed protein product [Ostreobium quekettii]|uniref:Peptidase S1 domain-containing protein n=1 Tax=Ostreobium quekettii TaxID=121088 RepID=A0A8S1IQT2_9CHLO|nr:unnamed protein product [Ostreobium quekettii]